LFSNVSFALVGQLMQNEFSESYQQLLVQHLLNPVGMKDTRIVLDSSRQQQLAQGYSLAGLPVAPWEYRSFESSVGLKSSVNDMLKFLRWQIDKSDELKELHQSIYATGIDKNTYVGKGWHVLKNKRYYDLVAHAGTTSGHRAFVGFIKESKTGIVVLSNSKTGMNGFGYLVLKMINHHWKKRKL
ncbi:MAG: serine hydrolase domain-containing protein, partial [Bacteroidota bacterium]